MKTITIDLDFGPDHVEIKDHNGNWTVVAEEAVGLQDWIEDEMQGNLYVYELIDTLPYDRIVLRLKYRHPLMAYWVKFIADKFNPMISVELKRVK